VANGLRGKRGGQVESVESWWIEALTSPPRVMRVVLWFPTSNLAARVSFGCQCRALTDTLGRTWTLVHRHKSMKARASGSIHEFVEEFVISRSSVRLRSTAPFKAHRKPLRNKRLGSFGSAVHTQSLHVGRPPVSSLVSIRSRSGPVECRRNQFHRRSRRARILDRLDGMPPPPKYVSATRPDCARLTK